MMKSKVFAVLAGAAVAMSAAGAMAADLPSPPWLPTVACPAGNAGCSQAVPDKNALKVSAAFGKLISKGTQGGLKCFSKGVGNILKGKSLPDGGLATCSTDNINKVTADGTKIVTKLSAKPETAAYLGCVVTNTLGFVQPSLTALIPDLLPVALCEGATDLAPLGYGGPSSISGTNSMLPSDKDILKTELAVIGASSKFGTAHTKCLDKGVANILKGKDLPDGGAVACLTDPAKSPSAKLTATLTKLAGKTALTPTCLWDMTGQANLAAGATKIATDLTTVNSLIYCNS